MNDSMLILVASGLVIAYLLYKILCLSEREKGRREGMHYMPMSMPMASHQGYPPPMHQTPHRTGRNQTRPHRQKSSSALGLTFFLGLILLVGMLIILFNDNATEKSTPTSNKSKDSVKSALFMKPKSDKSQSLWDDKLVNKPSPKRIESEFFIQIGSFSTLKNADKQVDFLLQKRLDSEYIHISESKNNFIVLFGPFTNKDWAEEKKDELEKILLKKTILKKQIKH